MEEQSFLSFKEVEEIIAKHGLEYDFSDLLSFFRWVEYRGFITIPGAKEQYGTSELLQAIREHWQQRSSTIKKHLFRSLPSISRQKESQGNKDLTYRAIKNLLTQAGIWKNT